MYIIRAWHAPLRVSTCVVCSNDRIDVPLFSKSFNLTPTRQQPRRPAPGAAGDSADRCGDAAEAAKEAVTGVATPLHALGASDAAPHPSPIAAGTASAQGEAPPAEVLAEARQAGSESRGVTHGVVPFH